MLLRQIKYFVTVVDTGSFTEAADLQKRPKNVLYRSRQYPSRYCRWKKNWGYSFWCGARAVLR